MASSIVIATVSLFSVLGLFSFFRFLLMFIIKKKYKIAIEVDGKEEKEVLDYLILNARTQFDLVPNLDSYPVMLAENEDVCKKIIQMLPKGKYTLYQKYGD